MKLLMTADTLGGVWSYAMELCSALGPLGAKITLATLGRAPDRDQRAQVQRLRHVNLRESEFKLEWMHAPWESLDAAGEWLRKIESDVQPDIVHLNHLVHGDLPWRAPVIVVGHSCVFSWWAAVRGGTPGPEWAEYRRRVRISLHAADHVIAPTRSMLSELCKHYGALPRTRVVPNARDPGAYCDGPKQPMIVSAGRLWDEAKNVQLLCRAAPFVLWPTFLFGPRTSPDGQEQHVEGAVNVGPVPHALMSRWLALASIYASPARYEPFGLSALEAALSGCALVLGDIESLREVWADAALYVPTDSSQELSEVINHLIARPLLLATFARRARERAIRYNPRRFAIAYWTLYEHLRESREAEQCASCSSITH